MSGVSESFQVPPVDPDVSQVITDAERRRCNQQALGLVEFLHSDTNEMPAIDDAVQELTTLVRTKIDVLDPNILLMIEALGSSPYVERIGDCEDLCDMVNTRLRDLGMADE